MGFLNKDMSVIAYANGFTLWHYASGDSIEQISKENYFPKGFAQLAHTGDIVIVNAGDEAACFRSVIITPDGKMQLTKLN